MPSLEDAVKDTRFDILIKFTQGRTVECGDHKWVPVAHGVVSYTYRDRRAVEIDSVDAAKSAGNIIDRHNAMASVWG